jgi:S-DNA-T family DNA segregation ATPase FtsK/SpoIIIE
MAEKKKSTNKGRKGITDRVSDVFRIKMSPEGKSLMLRCMGIAILIFAVFSLVSSISYMFTWKEDQSMIAQGIVSGDHVANLGGSMGLRWGSFLVADFLGFGSFAFIFLLGVYALRLFFWKMDVGLLRITFITVSGAFICSLLLSLFGSGEAFGGGLGGHAGYSVVLMISALVGKLVTVLLVLALAVVWLLCASGRFARWFAVAGADVGVKRQGQTEEKEADKSQEGDQDEQGDKDEETEDAGDKENEGGEGEEGDDSDGAEEGEGCEETQEGEGDEGEVEEENNAGQENSDGEGNDSGQIDVIRDDVLSADVLEELPRIDNREELERYEFPSLDLLEDYANRQHVVSQKELDINNSRIRNTLQNYKIVVDKVTAIVGPTVTLYKVVPAPGVRVSAIENLHREIAMSLGTSGVRVVQLHDSVGIEVPNDRPSTVPLKALLNSPVYRQTEAELPIAIGYTITQEVKTFDLTDAPHLLVAGATKQGKSVCLNVIIASLLYAKHPTELKFVFIDPKMVEFTAYNSLLKHYLAALPMAQSAEEEKKQAIVKTPQQAEQILNSLCIEMDERYRLLADARVNDFKVYNEKYKDRHLLPTDGHKYLPYLVVVIDEYADLIMSGGSNADAKKSAKNIEASIIRLAQKGRAAGIHVIIATQRPSVNVITGLIKANFPTRIAFRVLSGADSKTILDTTGAENLIGKGDMLYYAGVKMERIQCALVDMKEIIKVTRFIEEQNGYKQCCSTPYYLPVPVSQDGEAGGGTIDMQNIDSMFEDAARLVVSTQKGSTSDLQRRLGMGYARAGRVMDQLEAAGIVGPQDGSKPRKVLVGDLMELEELIASFLN